MQVLKNEDGKIELAFDDKRKLMVVDVVGTLMNADSLTTACT